MQLIHQIFANLVITRHGLPFSSQAEENVFTQDHHLSGVKMVAELKFIHPYTAMFGWKSQVLGNLALIS